MIGARRDLAGERPSYLILGDKDDDGFELSLTGWVARWEGTMPSTNFTVRYSAGDHRYQISQSWCGIEGRVGFYSAQTRLDQLILQTLLSQFPPAWDAFAKQILEKEFQITYFEQSSEALNFIGMPDGPFRAVAFPISVQSLRRVRQWLQALIEERPFAYPISVKAQLVHQSINFVEGKAPAWTTNQGQVFFCSLDDTGLSPNGFPVREVAQNGSAAWTLRRRTYVIFIDLPFAGLLDFLSRLMSENGPIRRRNQQELAIGMTPIVIPAGFECQARHLDLWDEGKTTRCFWHLSKDGDTDELLKLEAQQTLVENAAEELLKIAEEISSHVLGEFDAMLGNAERRSDP